MVCGSIWRGARVLGSAGICSIQADHSLAELGVVLLTLNDAVLPGEASCLVDTVGLGFHASWLASQALEQWAALVGHCDVGLLEEPMDSVVVPRVVAARIGVGGRRIRPGGGR